MKQILQQLEKGIINWYGAQILIEDLYKNHVVLDNVSERTFTFDQMMDVITEFSTWVDTSKFYTEGTLLKKELTPHIKTCVKR